MGDNRGYEKLDDTAEKCAIQEMQKASSCEAKPARLKPVTGKGDLFQSW
jgi:hypothetical protein